MTPTTPTIDLMNARCSMRAYSDEPITDAEKAAILHATMRAPTAGNLMLYSIVEIVDQSLKDRLAETCDHQPFIARAPWVLLFLADFQKWMDLFAATGANRLEGVPQDVTPGLGDLMIACCDALIAAQNGVIAAESLGIGSCYIGDILEQAETHAALLDLPRWTFPITMLCLGRPKTKRRIVARYERHVVHRDRYHRPSSGELREISDDLDRLYASRSPSDALGGHAGYVQEIYARKFAADFSLEANRSVQWWLDRWLKGPSAG